MSAGTTSPIHMHGDIPNVLRKAVWWPEDVDRKEKESFSWHMFQDNDWYGKTRKEAHLSWRCAGRTLRTLAKQQEAAGDG